MSHDKTSISLFITRFLLFSIALLYLTLLYFPKLSFLSFLLFLFLFFVFSTFFLVSILKIKFRGKQIQIPCFVLGSMSSILLVLGDGNDFEVKMTLRALEEAAPGWQIVTALTLEEVDRITEGGHVQVILLWTCPMNVLDRAVTR